MFKINKPTAPVLMLLAVACITSLLVSSCNNNTDSVIIPVPKDTSALASIKHFITVDQIKQYQAAFRIQNDSLSIKFPSLLIPDAEAFNKLSVLQILKDPRCVGIRIYHGVKTGGKRNEIRVILVGVDSQGRDIYVADGSPLAADITQPVGGYENGQCPSCQTVDQ